MDVYVGDRVQIRDGGMDVTNGIKAKSGSMYGEGGPLWATVVLIDNDWYTGGNFGLPTKVTKVRCQADNGVVVWQVRPEDIASNVIRASKPETVQTTPKPSTKAPEPAPTTQGLQDLTPTPTRTQKGMKTVGMSLNRFAIPEGQDSWSSGNLTVGLSTGDTPSTLGVSTKVISNSSLGEASKITYPSSGGWRNLTEQERKNIGTRNLQVDQRALQGAKFQTAWENPSKKAELLKENTGEHRNNLGFPYTDGSMASRGNIARKYDFQIVPGDPRYSTMVSLEDKLRDARAALGIPVHGSYSLAKAMKYFMYNRFKVPDTNLLHNRSVTYVFFTRPDLNILNQRDKRANKQTINHTEAAMVWRRYPEIFKLLTDSSRCGDDNNFNLLLSQQVRSFDIKDEDLSTVEAGKSWNEYTIPYGDSYSGRTAGEFSCNFEETQDYSIINLIKLWITYIDNVGRGAWSPSYNLVRGDGVASTPSFETSHIFTKTLDYAASAYVFKCGPDGEDVLYWSKYYGVFPINTGASALSWDNDSHIGTTPKLNIRFRYAFKRDLSPISLIEFNHNAKVDSMGFAKYENSFNADYAHSSRPFVGPPFVELFLGDPVLSGNGLAVDRARTSIRLKFKPASIANDDLLYRATLDGRS